MKLPRAAAVMIGLSTAIMAETSLKSADAPLPFPAFLDAPPSEPLLFVPINPFAGEIGGSRPENFGGVPAQPSDVGDVGSVDAAPAESSEESIVPPLPTPKSTRLEEIVDLRMPELRPGGELTESLQLIEHSWLNEVIDDHRLLWQPVRSSNDFVFRDRNGFGITSLGFKSDLFVDNGPIWADFSFGWHFLSGPRQPDVAAQVYDLSLGVHVAKQVDPWWTIHFHLAPTISTDWDNKSSDAFRLIGGVLTSYQATPMLSGVLGFSYLDRPDLPVLPIAGVRWMVTDEVLLDLLIPEPKVAYLLKANDNGTTWLYLKGEIGGGSWAIESDPDYDDRLGYRDARLLFGLETARVDGDRSVLELGYIFDRQLHFDRRGQTAHLGSTWSIRWGRTF